MAPGVRVFWRQAMSLRQSPIAVETSIRNRQTHLKTLLRPLSICGVSRMLTATASLSTGPAAEATWRSPLQRRLTWPPSWQKNRRALASWGSSISSFRSRGIVMSWKTRFAIHANPKRYFTTEYQQLTRAKIAGIRCPILLILGDQTNRLNTFNQETLIPELRRAGKALEVLEYPGEPHSFAFNSVASRTPRPAVAMQAFEDINAFLRRHLRTQAVPIDVRLVKQVPF